MAMGDDWIKSMENMFNLVKDDCHVIRPEKALPI